MSTQSDIETRTRILRQILDESGLTPQPLRRCPYLPDREARDIAFRVPDLAPNVYTCLMNLNYRRSGMIIYRPACGSCQECRALRVLVDAFRPNRTQRRCRTRNCDLEIQVEPAGPDEEKHELYRRYQAQRHDRAMDDSWTGFVDFLYGSPVESYEVIARLNGRLVMVGIFDREPTALSTVYCYFDPELDRRSLGTFNVLWTIEHCREIGVPYLYLGYYIADCRKMNYKIDFRPCEVLQPDGTWERVTR